MGEAVPCPAGLYGDACALGALCLGQAARSGQPALAPEQASGLRGGCRHAGWLCMGYAELVVLLGSRMWGSGGARETTDGAKTDGSYWPTSGGAQLRGKIENPLVFQWGTGGAARAYTRVWCMAGNSVSSITVPVNSVRPWNVIVI